MDHIRPLQHEGELFDLANLATLCFSCHWAKTSAEMGYRQPGPEQVAWSRLPGKNGIIVITSRARVVPVARVTHCAGFFYLEGNMNRLVKAQLALESRRSELGKLLDLEERGEDYQGKLEEAKAAVAAAQADLQTAAQAEPEVQERRQDNPAGAELRALEERANVGELYDSILSHGQPHGAMAELQQHLGLQANQIPLSLITGFEERAVTPAPGQVGQNQQGIIAYVFPQSAASFLGVDQPTVPVGEAVYTVLSSELAVGTPAENAAQD